MNIRRFRADSVSDALAMVKSELGDDAVILNTSRKRARDGSTGSFSSFVEVVAAVDFDADTLENAASDDTSPNAAPGKAAGKAPGASRGNKENHPSPGPDASRARWPLYSEETDAGRPVQPGRRQDADSGNGNALRAELQELRDLVERLAAVSSDSGRDGNGDIYRPEVRTGYSCHPLMVVHEVFDLLGIDATLQRAVAASFFSTVPAGRPVNHRTVYSWFRQYCEGLIVPGPQAESASSPCWWAFIGPTGVGKTTTLAKVAAHLKFRKGLRGHLVTVDTYRLGGVEQLAKYAELMEIPFSTARNTSELVEIFSRNRDLDFILVDTIGRNSRSSTHHIELEKLFDSVPGLKAQALLCATYKPEDMLATVRTYRRFPVAGWTLSKTDETVSAGCLYSPVIGWKLPLSYITDGQKVPEDIKPASQENVMKLLFSRGDAHFKSERNYTEASRPLGAGGAASRPAAHVEGQR